MQPDSLRISKCYFFVFFCFACPGCQFAKACSSLLLPTSCQVAAAVTTQGLEDLKRYIVKNKPVTHAAIQTLPPTRLARCQPSDDCNLRTLLLCAKASDPMRTDWHVLTVLNTVHARTLKTTCAHGFCRGSKAAAMPWLGSTKRGVCVCQSVHVCVRTVAKSIKSI